MIKIRQPDDFHHHFRDGEYLQSTVSYAEEKFGKILAMPNIVPPTTETYAGCIEYCSRIRSHLKDNSVTIYSALYLSEKTTVEDIVSAKNSNVVIGVKLYPRGATTHSQFGVALDAKFPDKYLPIFQAMSDLQFPLLVHGESTDPLVDIFDREQRFIEETLRPLITKFPSLRIVMEHITTSFAVQFVESTHSGIAATITPHHLLYSRNSLFTHGLHPSLYCAPILKTESDRNALIQAATSGNPKFFAGTDSAPHPIQDKYCECGKAGIFSTPVAVEIYASVFDAYGRLDQLEYFTSKFGSDFYGLPLNESYGELIRGDWQVPNAYKFSDSQVASLACEQTLPWKFRKGEARGKPKNS